MNVGSIVGVAIGIKLVNGKFKPKYGKSAIFGLIFIALFILMFIALLGCSIVWVEPKLFVASLVGAISMGYIFLISPYTQNSNNYYIEFENENTLDGFKLTYKGKQVDVQYKMDEKGKIAFADNLKKITCVSYADGSKMSNMTKYKIVNYFAKWLADNDLISEEVTVSLEM